MTRLIRGLHNLFQGEKNQALAANGTVVTIGNFDGVHIGHQALLKKVAETAKNLRAKSVAIVFEPQPFEFFAKGKIAPRLTRMREKFCLLAQYGMDAVLVIRFNKNFAAMTAEEFVQRVLQQGLSAKQVIVGDDFQFGRGREGDFAFLTQAGKKHGFQVADMPTLMLENERVSSTRVRTALAVNNVELVQRLLGRPYTMKGRVVHGDKRGRILGFPTANIFLHRVATPVQGIYVVKMSGIAEKPLHGVANVGTRPTVGGTKTLLEVHLFDFDRNIYGQQVCVEFCEKLREEEHFASLELMTEQIRRDAKAARNYFEMRGEL